MPDIMLENDDVLKVYSITSGQVITAGKSGMIIDLDHNALHRDMDLYEIENKRSVFERVIWLFHEVLKLQHDNDNDNTQDIEE